MRRRFTGASSLRSGGPWSSLKALASANFLSSRSLLFALLLPFAASLPQLQAQTFQIQAASPSVIGAGANGATLVLSGTLPTAASQLQTPAQVCFYTGYGTATAITPSLPINQAGDVSITVPAATIQGVPASAFTAANNYMVYARVYLVPTGTACDGTVDPAFTNTYSQLIAEPFLIGSVGPTNVPQTNSATGTQAAPTSALLTGNNFAPNSVVVFGSFGNITPSFISRTTLRIPVPPAFASSPVGTTAALMVCNVASSGNLCGPGSTVTLTVSSLVPSMGTLSITPNPTTTTGTTTLTAQFGKQTGSQLPEPGAPSGTVTFAANGSTVSTGQLTLDTTAVFAPQTTATQTATTATPVITPPSGSYSSAQTVSITDATSGSTIYYTLDGSTPTTSSPVYTAPFALGTTTAVSAIAAATGYVTSAVASNTYTVYNPIPTSLAFVVQPTTSATGAAITPPVTVAILDQNNNTITTSTSPVTLQIGTNPGEDSLSGTTTVNAVNGIATFSDLSIASIANGYTLVATSGNLVPATSSTFNITPYPISVHLFDPLIGVTSTLPGTFTLSHPAPAGGLVVSLASSAPTLVTVSPATVTIAAGETTGSFTYTGVAVGPATITASAPNYLAGSASVTATFSLVSLGTIQPVAPGQSISLALSLATNAPAGGVTINFTSSNPGVATVTSSVFVPQGQRTAAANPQITGVIIGSTVITATAQGYAPDTRNVNVTVVATFNPTSVSVNLATLSTTTLNISAPAQTGGLTFTLVSADPTKATVISSVTIPQGQTSVPVPITGVANGSTTITASSPGVTSVNLTVNVTSQLGFYSGATQITGANLQVPNYVFLPVAPPAPITVILTSNGPNIATISTSATVVGGTTLTFDNVTTSGNVLAFYVQGQAPGTTTLTVTAPGYTTGTVTITVYPSGFVLQNQAISTTTLSTPTNFSVFSAILNPSTLTVYTTAALNPGLAPVSVPVTSSNTAVGTITTSPLVFNPNTTTQQSAFQPSSAGTTNISLGTPAGFSTPSNQTQITATVTAPALSFYTGATQITGAEMQVSNYVFLPVAPPSPITVTLTSNGPATATISTSATAVGGTTLTFTNVSTSGNALAFYVQGQTAGTTTLTVSAPGYTSGTLTVNVYPSGFVLQSNSISTSTFSTPTPVNVYPAILNPSTLTVYTSATLNPGLAPVSVPVTSSNTAVGTITSSPLVFNPNATTQQTTFQPSSAGTTNISVGVPAGFSTPANQTQITATVTAPALSFNNGNQITGANLQVNNNAYLPVAPPSPITVTMTSNNPAIATISTSAAVVGGTSLTFPNVSAGGFLPAFYVQGQAVGTTTLTVAAPGYTSATATITVYPSGFVLQSNSISTTTFSPPNPITVYPAILNPSTLTVNSQATLNPGLAPISVSVTSSNTVVGTITASPLVFNPNTNSLTTNFQPSSAGTTTIAVGVPAGFSTPSNQTQITATVTAPALSFGSPTQITGANMQVPNFAFLPVAPPNPVTVTVTSSDPSLVTLSKSTSVVGTASLTFTNVTVSGAQSFYVQGQGIGSTTLTVSAPGYTNATATITVYPSGFTFANQYSSGLSTTASSSPTTLTVYPSILNPGILSFYTYGQLNPGLAGTSVQVTSSNTGVGTITTSPLIFNGGESSLATTFKPLATGTTNLNIVQPSGYSNPSQYVTIPATVQ